MAFQLRYRVFVEELHREIAGARPEQGIEEPSDEHATILLGYDGDMPVATVTINALADGPVTDEWMAHCRIDDFLPRFPASSIVIVHKALVLPAYRASRLFPMLVERLSGGEHGKGWPEASHRHARSRMPDGRDEHAHRQAPQRHAYDADQRRGAEAFAGCDRPAHARAPAGGDRAASQPRPDSRRARPRDELLADGVAAALI